MISIFLEVWNFDWLDLELNRSICTQQTVPCSLAFILACSETQSIRVEYPQIIPMLSQDSPCNNSAIDLNLNDSCSQSLKYK